MTKPLLILSLAAVALAASSQVHASGSPTGTFSVPQLVPRLPTHEDTGLEARLARIGAAFDGQVGIYVEDLESGTYAGWNERTQLPAASTVKLGVVAEGIRRFGYGPGSPVDADLRAIGEWSSNKAANHLFRLVGGVGPTEAALHRLGMFASTYPTAYTLSPSEKPKKKRHPKARTTAGVTPVGGHTRVTTARDLARALFRLQAAAAGQRWAVDTTGLTSAEAAAALGYLSLARPDESVLAFPPGTRHVEKDGWIDDVRASAALVYGRGLARIVVVLAYRPGVTLAEAHALGERVSALALG